MLLSPKSKTGTWAKGLVQVQRVHVGRRAESDARQTFGDRRAAAISDPDRVEYLEKIYLSKPFFPPMELENKHQPSNFKGFGFLSSIWLVIATAKINTTDLARTLNERQCDPNDVNC